MGIIKSEKTFYNIFLQFLVCVILWIATGGTIGFFTIKGMTLAVFLTAFLLWFIFAGWEDERFYSQLFKLIWPLIICFSFLGVYLFVGVNSTIVKPNLINLAYVLVFASIFLYYSRNWSKYKSKVFIAFWLIDILIACVYSIYRLRSEPNLARLLATGYSSPSTAGVVSFGITYGLALFFPFFVWCLFDKNCKWKYRILIILALIVFALTILFAAFTIAILLTLLSVALVIYFKIRYKFAKKFKLISIIVLCVLLIGGIVFLDNILLALSTASWVPDAVGVRFKELLDLIKGDISKSSDVYLRYEVYATSVKAIFDNYLFGYQLFGNSVPGGHSEILDMFANYGVICFIFCTLFFVKFYTYVKQYLSKDALAIYKISIIILVLQSLINTSMWSPTMVIFMFIEPLFLVSYSKNKKAKTLESKLKY